MTITVSEPDEEAFARLVEPFAAELHAHCYRMLGSLQDAEDALQEVRLRAWRGLAGFEGRSSMRAWLHRIAANVCLDEIDRRQRRVLPIDHEAAEAAGAPLREPILEPIWVEPFPDDPEASYAERESVELAFVAALQHLPGNQRAALILCEVLGFSAKDAAGALETSVASVTSALQRSRRFVDNRLPDRSQQQTLRALGDARLSELIARYTAALQDGDVEAILALLGEDAAWTMPPLPSWFEGREAIGRFLAAGPCTQRWRHLPICANGQVALGCYLFDEGEQAYLAHVIDVLAVRDDGAIASVTAFLDASLFWRFGLPARLEG